MREEDEIEPVPGKLGETLYELGLLTADEYEFQRMLNSPELKRFEEWLRVKNSN